MVHDNNEYSVVYRSRKQPVTPICLSTVLKPECRVIHGGSGDGANSLSLAVVAVISLQQTHSATLDIISQCPQRPIYCTI